MSCLDASEAYPYPGASTKYVGKAELIVKNASYFVLPGFLLVST